MVFLTESLLNDFIREGISYRKSNVPLKESSFLLKGVIRMKGEPIHYLNYNHC